MDGRIKPCDVPCEDCHLLEDEYIDLVEKVSFPLYQVAVRFLNDQHMGLAQWAIEPSEKVKDAIRLVHSEGHRIDEEMRSQKNKPGGNDGSAAQMLHIPNAPQP